jgi:hypothetical protein
MNWPLHFICLGCLPCCLPRHELFPKTCKLSYYFFIVNGLCKVYQLSLFSNLFHSVVAFACTNGGCTESQHFGPYSTQAS